MPMNFIVARALLVGTIASIFAGCGPSRKVGGSTVGSGLVDGQSKTVQVDPNQGGQASALQIEEIHWGRLVDIYDAEDDDKNPNTPPIRSLILREFLISENVISDGANYELVTNPFTDQAELTIFADFDSAAQASGLPETQSERFKRLLEDTTVNLGFVSPVGTGSSFLPPFPLVPRNAALSIRVSDLLDHASVNAQTVRVLTGTPSTQQFGARVLPDPNFGAFIENAGEIEFHSTRILVDFTVSEAEKFTSSAPVNSIGLPASTSALVTNVTLRIATKPDAATAKFQVVRNVAGHALSFNNNGPSENNLTADIIRNFRSGRSGDQPSNLDPNNGFLLDLEAPRILGSQEIQFVGTPTLVSASSAEGDSPTDVIFLLDMQFATEVCAQTTTAGNILRMRGGEFGDLFAEVTRQSSPPQEGLVTDVRVRLLPIPATVSMTGLREDFLEATSGEFQSVFGLENGVQPGCFLKVTPTPGSPPVGQISTQSNFSVRFSEAMSPASITAHESFRIDRLPSSVPPGPAPDQSIVASISASDDLREFRFSPLTPFDHVMSPEPKASDDLYLTLLGGANGVVDLAGNPLADALSPDIRFTINPMDPTVRTGGLFLLSRRLTKTETRRLTQVIPTLKLASCTQKSEGSFRGIWIVESFVLGMSFEPPASSIVRFR